MKPMPRHKPPLNLSRKRRTVSISPHPAKCSQMGSSVAVYGRLPRKTVVFGGSFLDELEARSTRRCVSLKRKPLNLMAAALAAARPPFCFLSGKAMGCEAEKTTKAILWGASGRRLSSTLFLFLSSSYMALRWYFFLLILAFSNSSTESSSFPLFLRSMLTCCLSTCWPSSFSIFLCSASLSFLSRIHSQCHSVKPERKRTDSTSPTSEKNFLNCFFFVAGSKLDTNTVLLSFSWFLTFSFSSSSSSTSLLVISTTVVSSSLGALRGVLSPTRGMLFAPESTLRLLIAGSSASFRAAFAACASRFRFRGCLVLTVSFSWTTEP
mmetsp:Transcript_9334/g.15998  ORF Transcript_9334/g.15998 Transcript_9334/m.15998 type:complete len:323 (+) Transcript_9334:199-1167(+)